MSLAGAGRSPQKIPTKANRRFAPLPLCGQTATAAKQSLSHAAHDSSLCTKEPRESGFRQYSLCIKEPREKRLSCPPCVKGGSEGGIVAWVIGQAGQNAIAQRSFGKASEPLPCAKVRKHYETSPLSGGGRRGGICENSAPEIFTNFSKNLKATNEKKAIIINVKRKRQSFGRRRAMRKRPICRGGFGV